MGYIEGIERNQAILFPEVIDDYIEEDNPVRFIDVFADNLDFVELGFKYSELKETGRPPYNPADMLKLYIYGYLNRIRSSRCLEKESHWNVELMWLLKKLTPDFKTIADFRKDIYICPDGKELRYTGQTTHHGKAIRLYKSQDCKGCRLKTECTRNKRGRVIYRWEHEQVLEDMKKRVEENKIKVKIRQWLSEHPFGTIKRGSIRDIC